MFHFWCPVPVQVRTNTQTYRETCRETYHLVPITHRYFVSLVCEALHPEMHKGEKPLVRLDDVEAAKRVTMSPAELF